MPSNATRISRPCAQDDLTARFHDGNDNGGWPERPQRNKTSVNRSDRVSTLKEGHYKQIVDANVVILAGTSASEQSTGTASEDAEDYEFGLLVNAPGIEITYYTCIACHPERTIAQ
ncbi:MAG: hypothetical protein OXE94_05150 [Aestuariivita sp.]|nr:hypothetical protein [Aestuariivita sp.]MCY4201967.1 hypothetical protein [Aestuariivita sp.]MCY4288224.1 hypothetical protein [Aestuariivita sp.]MCY4346213.1 hypothetical protein [Aestuariivita sp.]